MRDRVEKYKPRWIIGKHHWYQWDVDKQHLFVITNDSTELIDQKNPLEVWIPNEKDTILEKLVCSLSVQYYILYDMWPIT